jgi:hypothetical protein
MCAQDSFLKMCVRKRVELDCPNNIANHSADRHHRISCCSFASDVGKRTGRLKICIVVCIVACFPTTQVISGFSRSSMCAVGALHIPSLSCWFCP